MSGMTDREIFGLVRWALEKDRRIHGALSIHLSVENGIVQLWGNVGSAAEKGAADALAREQPGVNGVINALTVAMRSPAEDDHQLTGAVAEVLARSSRRSKDIGVADVSRGVVRLAGHAASVSEERAAIRAASSVPGVRDVVSEVTIGAVPLREAIEVFDDAALKSSVSSAIAERGLTLYKEDLEVRDGVVTLNGIVTGEGDARLAEEIAAAIAGVRDTVNQLVVGHSPASRDADEALAARVTQALGRDGRVSAASVHVECVNGEAHLFGEVDSIAQQNAAVEVTRKVPGIRRVFSDVQIVDKSSLPKADIPPGLRSKETE